MTPEEIEAELKKQEQEEKARTTFTKEMLELVLSQFALSILKHENLKLEPSQFKFLLEENMLGSAAMRAGNPVIIHINMKELGDALLKKGKYLYDFKKLIENSLRTVPRLLHTLAVIPARDIARWHDDLHKYKWHQGSDTELFPKLLPDSEIHYDISLRIIATHVKTDTKVIVSDRKMDLVKLRRTAREVLSEEVFNPKEEKIDDISNSNKNAKE